MHEKTRLAQNSHMNIVNVGIDVLTPKEKKTLPLTLHVAPSTPTQNSLNCEKALQRWAYKKMKIFIVSIFKMTSPLIDKALPSEMTVTFIHFEEKWSRTEKIISSYWVTETSQSEE